MTEAERHILTKHRRGEHITPAETCASIATMDELRAYRDGLKQRGALTTDALAAIVSRFERLGGVWK